MLALNLVDRSWSGLLKPLDWNQGAPLGFLLVVKAVISCWGSSEAALRFIPYLASLVGLCLFAVLIRRLFSGWVAVAGMALYAVSPQLVSYAAECKQYAVDGAVATGLLLIFELCRRHSNRGTMLVVASSGACAIWLSHPAIFVLAGIGFAFAVRTVAGGTTWQLMRLAACAVMWLLSFALVYYLNLRHLTSNDYLLNYWRDHFVPSLGLAWVAWIWDHFMGGIAVAVGTRGTLVGALLILSGIVGVWSEQRDWLWLVIGVVGAAGVAAAWHRYPLVGRMLIFLIPLLVLLIVWGIARLWQFCGSRGGVIVGLVVLAVGLSALLEDLREWHKPTRTEEIRPLLRLVRQRWQPGDKVLVLRGAVPAFLFYTKEHPFPPGVVWSQCERFSGAHAVAEWRRLLSASRVWVLASHYRPEEEAVLHTLAQSTARCEAQWRTVGAWLCLYQPLHRFGEAADHLSVDLAPAKQ
jgi:hypothetical protein